jgi:hypothetical protein
VQLCDLIDKFKVPRVTVETNGIGQFAPSFLRMAIRQRGLTCSVVEEPAVQNKNRRIIEAIEPLVQSGMLWAHSSVLDGPLYDQMKEFNPGTTRQADDLLDAGAGAVTDQPARIGGHLLKNSPPPDREDWRPSTGDYEAVLEH